jgi:hypothetical protein
MPHGGHIWETLLYGLAGTSSGPYAQRRDRILAALREVGFDPAGAAALDEDALDALPAHVLVIVASDGADDDFTFVALPEDAIGDLDGALRACADETVDVGTAADRPDLWKAWVEIALASGARDAAWFTEAGDDLPIDADAAAAIAERWADHAFRPSRGGRLDGENLDRRFTRTVFVLERV